MAHCIHRPASQRHSHPPLALPSHSPTHQLRHTPLTLTALVVSLTTVSSASLHQPLSPSSLLLPHSSAAQHGSHLRPHPGHREGPAQLPLLLSRQYTAQQPPHRSYLLLSPLRTSLTFSFISSLLLCSAGPLSPLAQIGACRHGDRCSRNHLKPHFSQTILIPHLYNPSTVLPSIPTSESAASPTYFDRLPDEAEFTDFFEDVLDELALHGRVDDLLVVHNAGDHLHGNVYAKFHTEEEAAAALKAVQGRFYRGRKVQPEVSPVSDFSEAVCGMFRAGFCERGEWCNFIQQQTAEQGAEEEAEGGEREGGGTAGAGDERKGETGETVRGGGGGRGPNRRRRMEGRRTETAPTTRSGRAPRRAALASLSGTQRGTDRPTPQPPAGGQTLHPLLLPLLLLRYHDPAHALCDIWAAVVHLFDDGLCVVVLLVQRQLSACLSWSAGTSSRTRRRCCRSGTPPPAGG